MRLVCQIAVLAHLALVLTKVCTSLVVVLAHVLARITHYSCSVIHVLVVVFVVREEATMVFTHRTVKGDKG